MERTKLISQTVLIGVSLRIKQIRLILERNTNICIWTWFKSFLHSQTLQVASCNENTNWFFASIRRKKSKILGYYLSRSTLYTTNTSWKAFATRFLRFLQNASLPCLFVLRAKTRIAWRGCGRRTDESRLRSTFQPFFPYFRFQAFTLKISLKNTDFQYDHIVFLCLS